MDTESVVLGKWDNHGKKMNVRLSAQNSQKVDTETELKLKHGNKHIMTVETTGDLKKSPRIHSHERSPRPHTRKGLQSCRTL